ncbi:hypothetical protein OJ253_1052 [Cryptosporidium canis]|uniref:FAM50A/XAP5 C-terminal domain-containing protein n=1 Tax=Cryptosporidium canis TaxID=195482 RepID=A0A9D5HYB7_9CRYT|nr:hypothetical protein OJ253_1052 [Cryptosporidium canis]
MFYSKSTEDEEQFRSKTVGLVSVETYKRHMSSIRRGGQSESSPKKARTRPEPRPKTNKPCTLSFDFDQEIEDGGHGGGSPTKTLGRPVDELAEGHQGAIGARGEAPRLDFGAIGKDSTTDTSFLPDKKRELEEAREKERLRTEELEQEERLKREIIEVVFSYWDGSGHRRSVRVPRNTTIGEFLEECRLKLKSEFKEFSRLSSSACMHCFNNAKSLQCALAFLNCSASLMYIKEDVILPHTITFHELIKTKARGKSGKLGAKMAHPVQNTELLAALGPLFHFNVFDDVREMHDARKETTESHAGKVVKRQWYEKNKHVFPAYRWENYVPGKFNKPYSMRD